jgi:regulator of protease activity HflC (stomatin/prohibitin superfamily)
MDMGVAAEAEEQRLVQEAQAKAMSDQQVEMEAKAKADQEAQGHLPPPPFRPLVEQSFMQYMQFMQETQNKFMQELMGQIGAGRVPEVRG